MADTVTVVDGGLDIVTNRIIGAGTEPKFVHWGEGGATAAASTDTALVTPRGEGIVTGTGTQQTTTTTNDTYRVVGTLLCASSSAAINEAGLFDSSGGGNLFLRGTFTAIPLNVGDSIQFTINTVFDQV